MPSNVLLLTPYTQNYDWGKLGEDSEVARLVSRGYSVPTDPARPYAELWMGEHVNGPCFVNSEDGSKVPISTWISHEKYESIPFLFKVLSVRKALSIQSHPDSALAARLHAEFPTVYKDGNAKPELAIALTKFKAMFGFRPLDEILSFFSHVPSLSALIGEDLVTSLKNASTEDSKKSALKSAYSALLHAPQSSVQSVIESLLNPPHAHLDPTLVQLVSDLNSQFPGGDVGVLSVFFLNIVDLNPGECMYMGPNVPHAYLTGDIIECMTCSDNVIRGGLTPKFKDVETLINSLEFKPMETALLSPNTGSANEQTWEPDDAVPFAVSKFVVSHLGVQFRSVANGVSIGLVLRGDVVVDTVLFKQGQSCLIRPDSSITLKAPDGESSEFFVAFNPL